jgi:exonuclease III
MLTFLFWNLNGKNLISSLDKLVVTHEVDILILAECNHPELIPGNLLLALNSGGQDAQFHYVPDKYNYIQIFTSFPKSYVMPVAEDNKHYTMRRITLPGRDEVLLVAAHLLSQLHAKEDTLYAEAIKFAEKIRSTETELGHSRTIVVGDLNMNPFSNGVVAARGLHGVMTQKIARKKPRTVQKEAYPYFYNPMWGYFGESTNSPPGTYYYDKSGHVCYFWNIFDQVLVRPDLLSQWDDESLRILTSNGQQSFLTAKGLPDTINFSDHLPLLFRLNL